MAPPQPGDHDLTPTLEVQAALDGYRLAFATRDERGRLLASETVARLPSLQAAAQALRTAQAALVWPRHKEQPPPPTVS